MDYFNLHYFRTIFLSYLHVKVEVFQNGFGKPVDYPFKNHLQHKSDIVFAKKLLDIFWKVHSDHFLPIQKFFQQNTWNFKVFYIYQIPLKYNNLN